MTDFLPTAEADLQPSWFLMITYGVRGFLRRLRCMVFGHDWFAINDRDRKCLKCGRFEAEPWLPAGEARSGD